jgi:hypothetical protein
MNGLLISASLGRPGSAGVTKPDDQREQPTVAVD